MSAKAKSIVSLAILSMNGRGDRAVVSAAVRSCVQHHVTLAQYMRGRLHVAGGINDLDDEWQNE